MVSALSHLGDLQDFTVGLLDPVEHAHVIPEAALGVDLVGRKDVHLVDISLASALLSRGLEAAHNLELAVLGDDQPRLRRHC